jgi:PhzF family phenazine biosynthesis protein
MKRVYKLYQVDAFTKEKFVGNPAGVVLNADGLTTQEMQKIARELNNSETAFLFNSEESTYDVHTRYFTPTSEVPICGHATIASQFVRALESKEEKSLVYNKTGAGILPVEIIARGSEIKVAMTQGEVVFGQMLTGRVKEKLLAALQLEEGQLLENAAIQAVSTGHSKVMIGLKSNKHLNSLCPDMDGLKAISKEIDCNGFYVFTLNAEGEYLVRGRMFAPAIGINEDPVTGNANGPVGAYLVHHKLVENDGERLRFKALQGEAMERPGLVEVEVGIKDGQPEEVKVIGNAVIVFKTDLEM